MYVGHQAVMAGHTARSCWSTHCSFNISVASNNSFFSQRTSHPRR